MLKGAFRAPCLKKAKKEDPLSPETFQKTVNVSRETLDALIWYVEALHRWQEKINLVSSSSLGAVWRRHILDCAQLYPLIPERASQLVDMGAGAGLPGAIIAILARDRPSLNVALIESNAKKCGFLHHVIGELGLNACVVRARLEIADTGPADVVTARALAPLPQLMTAANRFAKPGQPPIPPLCLFLKGQDVGLELTETAKCWSMDYQCVPSLSDLSGAILVIKDFAPC